MYRRGGSRWRSALRDGAVLAIICGAIAPAFAQESVSGAAQSDDQSGDPSLISVASRYRQPLRNAPAEAIIVTREDIERLHPRSLAEILNHVPGLHVQPSDNGQGSIFVERGRNRNIEVMVDGVPLIHGLIFGWGSMDDVLPYDIDRVEILLGPASATYGADAAGGVINVITSSGAARSELSGGAMVGSFATKDLWARVGKEFSDVAFSLYAARRDTDQSDASIGNDAQTYFDELYHTHASLAPGPLAQHRNVTDLEATMRAGDWKLSVGQFSETDFHLGAGLAEALDPTGISDSRLGTATLSYHSNWGRWQITGYSYYAYTTYGGSATLYPVGAFGGAFPDGVLVHTTPTENRWRSELWGVYSTGSGHTLVVGGGYLTDVMPAWANERNFLVQDQLLIPTAYGPQAPVDARAVRATDYAFAEDAWVFKPDWTATLGGRVDAYSQFGTQFNPRAALVWDQTSSVTWKFSYTTAFQPPSVSQSSSNGIVFPLGNSQLNPELDRGLSLTNSFVSGGWQTDVTVFGFDDDRIIEVVSDPLSVDGQQYANAGISRGYGVEAQGQYQWTNGASVQLAYDTFALSHETSAIGDYSEEVAARHHLSAVGNVPIAAGWGLGANLIEAGDYYRAAGDTRPAPPSYTLVGFNVNWHSAGNSIAATGGLRNAFNTLAIEPDSTSVGPVPGIPLPGRELYLTVTLHR